MEARHQTELGDLPTSWRVGPLGDFLTEAQYGVSVKGGESGNCPILRMTNQVNGRISSANLQYAELAECGLAKFRVRRGDILFNRTNSFELVGRTAIFDLEGDYVFASYLIRLRTLADELDPFYLNRYLGAQFTQRRLKSIASRAVSQSNISATRLRGFVVPVPPLAEQRRIAGVLGLVQRAVEQQVRLLALVAELKQTLLHYLFTYGLRGEPQKPTDLGPIPQSWDMVPLSDCARVQTGVAKGRKLDGKETLTLPYLRVANVQSGYLNLREMKTITILAKEKPRYLLQQGDVVLTEGGDFDKLGRGFIWNGEIADCVHQNHIFAVRVDHSRVMPEFFAHLSQSPYGKAFFLSVAHKTTNLACINTTKLKAFPVLIPSQPEQREIVSVMETVDAKLSQTQRKHAALASLFRTLLHQLMTAQLRVADLDVESLLAQAVPEPNFAPT